MIVCTICGQSCTADLTFAKWERSLTHYKSAGKNIGACMHCYYHCQLLNETTKATNIRKERYPILQSMLKDLEAKRPKSIDNAKRFLKVKWKFLEST